MSSPFQYRTNHRTVVSSLALLPVFSGSLLTVQASAQTTSGEATAVVERWGLETGNPRFRPRYD